MTLLDLNKIGIVHEGNTSRVPILRYMYRNFIRNNDQININKIKVTPQVQPPPPPPPEHPPPPPLYATPLYALYLGLSRSLHASNALASAWGMNDAPTTPSSGMGKVGTV